MALFAAALLALRHELRLYSYHQIAAEFKSLPYWKVLLAFSFTVLNYVILTCYDLLAYRVVYYLLPLLAASAYLAFNEVSRRARPLLRLAYVAVP